MEGAGVGEKGDGRSRSAEREAKVGEEWVEEVIGARVGKRTRREGEEEEWGLKGGNSGGGGG